MFWNWLQWNHAFAQHNFGPLIVMALDRKRATAFGSAVALSRCIARSFALDLANAPTSAL